MARRLLIGLALAGYNCTGGGKPPQPPTPPTPTPEPPPLTLPAKGVPTGPERLLRIAPAGPRLQTNDGKPFDMVMAVPCCMGWARVPNQRWPMASEQFMDETIKLAAANAFHFRVGPWYGDADHESEWADVGGAYIGDGPDWNPKFWEKVRELVWHAYKAGSYVEVVPIDTWYVKHCQWGDQQCPWPRADITAAFNGTFSTQQERLLRKAVEELGCFGNVIWATGNEEDEVPAGGSLYQKYVETLRDEEAKSGCGFAHIIGTGSSKDGIAADYSITHERAPLTGLVNGRWTLNNEHNPEFPPDQEASYFLQAKQLGLAYAAWRAGASDADWERRLRLFKGADTLPAGCYPPPDDGNWTAVQDGPPGTRADEVKAGQAELGSLCKEPKAHQNGTDAIRSLNAHLREKGYCVGAVGSDDAAMFQSEDGPRSGVGTLWEEHHAVAPFDTGCWATSPAFYPKTIWRYNGTWAPPTNQPPPSGGDGCSDPEPPPLYGMNGPVEHGAWYDATPIVAGHDYCESIGLGTMPDGTTPRAHCPPRSECPGLKCEERAACERQIMGGVATWRSDGALEVNEANENRLQARCSGCTWIEVCDHAGATCSRRSTQ